MKDAPIIQKNGIRVRKDDTIKKLYKNIFLIIHYSSEILIAAMSRS